MRDGLQHWSHYSHFMLTLIAVLDPFMAIPIFLAMPAGQDTAARGRQARSVTSIVLAVLVGAAVGGDAVLRVLGTSLASFRVAGGLVLLLMALAMLQSSVAPAQARKTSGRAGSASAFVVPLAIPLLAGPGAISTVMIAAQGGTWLHQGLIIGAIALVCLTLWGMLCLSLPISRLLGSTGFNIANRLLGLLLVAIAVESMADGLRQLFPALGG